MPVEIRPRSIVLADQPNQKPGDALRGDQPRNPADAGNSARNSSAGKIGSATEKAQEDAAKHRAREGGYQ
ncbi:hypothetical protein [Azospirillum sp. B506]|uniref:hypothetical protein n=1 Tax=Azospirillum sp. B506 TaxID=137721 RepID=UPI00034B560A|nr:hypothetical protein [Azospirillum sp. B506]